MCNFKISSKKIRPRVQDNLDIANEELDEKIRGLQNSLSAAGMANSGRYIVQLSELLLKHIDLICEIIWDGISSYIKEKHIELNALEIQKLMLELSQQTVDLVEAKLKEEVEKQRLGDPQAERLFNGQKLKIKINSKLSRRAQQFSIQTLPFETIAIARFSNKVSIGSILIAMAALVASIYFKSS